MNFEISDNAQINQSDRLWLHETIIRQPSAASILKTEAFWLLALAKSGPGEVVVSSTANIGIIDSGSVVAQNSTSGACRRAPGLDISRATCLLSCWQNCKRASL